jgi:alkylation response protein AidB-like acyl-CoA dehydrogenase
MHEVVQRAADAAPAFRENAAGTEEAGRLSAETAKQLRDVGVIRMLQPKDFGGYECHPCEFFEAVMSISSSCGAAGWIAGIVGVHPFELALMDRKLQEEVWGDDPDTWLASPYAPTGIARRVEGGYVLNGRWSFSSGTDECQWVFLGAMVGDESGEVADPPDSLHVVLPRSDYTIVDGSWEVAGLGGTGSKDVIVADAFIPEYRTLRAAEFLDQTFAKKSDRWDDSPLYRMPWSSIFPNAITAAVIGACEGVIEAHLDYQRNRISPFVGPAVEDSLALHAVGKAASDVHSARTQMLWNVGRAYDIVSAGGEVDLAFRTAARRDQVRGSWRAVEAIDELVPLSGGSAMRLQNPMQRLWRDAHMGLHHGINVSNGVYQFYTSQRLGIETDPPVKMTI